MISERKLIHQFIEMTNDELLIREAELWEELKKSTIAHNDDKQADVYKELNMIREFALVHRQLAVPERVINEAEIRKWYGMPKIKDENPNIDA